MPFGKPVFLKQLSAYPSLGSQGRVLPEAQA